MPDNITKNRRSWVMSRVRSEGTSPEMVVRRGLHAAKFRYRLHTADLPGKPDIVLRRYNTVVFVQGCLWHWHGCRRSRMPSSNSEYWQAKIQKNQTRDRINHDRLRSQHWLVEVIWECEVEKGVEKLVSVLMAIKTASQGRQIGK
ncbi:MAG: DNA mismatch endonuclease Vsr [SAR202 cluster bacterium]|nr:DNA mismatch endonuclease Vsr [SAR202 cluster bacterium]